VLRLQTTALMISRTCQFESFKINGAIVAASIALDVDAPSALSWQRGRFLAKNVRLNA
jgi:hypothetical protein